MPTFRSLLPKLSIAGCTIGANTWEAEGHTLSLRWLGLVFEVTIAREDVRQ